METSSFYSNRASGQFPTASNIHINEVSKGVHKLNQILSACSNGLNLDRNSIEIGRELLKGAVDLEESLRMLVNFQEASEYTNSSKKKSRIKLLDEDEDDEDHNEKRVEQWKLSRPKFSFDKTSGSSRSVQGETRRQQLALPYKHETSEEPMSDSKLVPHKTFNSYVQDFSVSTHNYTSSSKSTQEKVRISNVIAKLMGLEEIPIKDGLVGGKNDQNGKEWKQGKVSRESSKQNVPLTRESRNGSDHTTNKKLNSTSITLPRRESKLQNKPEKSQETLDSGSRLVIYEKDQPMKDLKMQAVGMEAKPSPKPGTMVMKKQQNHTNHVNGLKSSEDSMKKQTHKEDKQGKTVEREGKKLVLNAELQKRAQNSKINKGEDKTINRIEQEISANSGEKRNGNNYLAKTQRKVQDQQALTQDQLPKIPDHSEEKNQKPQQPRKQNLEAKNHEAQQVEHTNAPKPRRSTAMTLQKKLPHNKFVPVDGKCVKPNEKVPMKGPEDRKHQDVNLIIDNSQRFAAKESPKIEGQSHDSSKTESQLQSNVEKGSSNPADEKPIEVSATQKRTVAAKVQRREIPEKIEVLMTRRNMAKNHLTRSTKGPANMLKELKQQMQNKNRRSKNMEEPSGSKIKEANEVMNASEIIAEPVKLEVKIENEDVQMLINSAVADEFQNPDIQNKPNLNNKVSSKKCERVILKLMIRKAYENFYFLCRVIL